MTDQIRINGKTEFAELSAFVQAHKGKTAFALDDNGIQIYASDRAAAEPDAKGLADAMRKSAASPTGQDLARKALYISLSNTYGKDVADHVVMRMRQDLLAPDASLSDLMSKATDTIDNMFKSGGLDDQSELYRQQAAILDDAKLVADADRAAGKDGAPKDKRNAAFENGPVSLSDRTYVPPASAHPHADGIVAELREPIASPVVAEKDDKEPPRLDPHSGSTAGLDTREDGDDDNEAVREASTKANKAPEEQLSAAAASGAIRELPADLAKVHGALDKMQDVYDDIQLAVSRSQQKQAARRRAMIGKNGGHRAATVDQAMNATYRDNIRKMMGQNFIDVAERGGGNGVPSFTKLLESANLPTDNAVVRDKAKEYVLEAFRSYDKNDFNTLTNAQRANDVALPALQKYHDLREI